MLAIVALAVGVAVSADDELGSGFASCVVFGRDIDVGSGEVGSGEVVSGHARFSHSHLGGAVEQSC